MQLHESPGQRQAETGALPPLPVPTTHLLELLKDPPLVLRGDTDSRVPHRNAYCCSVAPRRDTDLAPIGGELDGVG